jgi:hypothetical protein
VVSTQSTTRYQNKLFFFFFFFLKVASLSKVKLAKEAIKEAWS